MPENEVYKRELCNVQVYRKAIQKMPSPDELLKAWKNQRGGLASYSRRSPSGALSYMAI